MSTSGTTSRFLFAAVYAAAALVLLDQGAELVAALVPFRAGEVDWRFGAFGLLVGRTTTAVLADVLVFVAAVGSGHRTFLRVWGVVHLAVAAVVVTTLVIFSLDVVELRRRVTVDAAGTFLVSSLRAGVVAVVAAVYCVWAGVAAFRAPGQPVANGRGATAPLLVQRPG